jgi:hypothetical protein
MDNPAKAWIIGSMRRREENSRHKRRRLKVMLERTLDASIQERRCDGCTGCCTALTILELNKPADVTCRHVCATGCSIYADRPKACSEYLCAWKIGIGTSEQRPDKVGIVLSPTEPGTPCYPAFVAHELYPDAFVDAYEYLTDIAQAHVLLLMRDDLPKRILGPEYRILGMKADIAEIRRLNSERRACKAR